MKKLILLLAIISVWFVTTGCNTHSDSRNLAEDQNATATNTANSIRLALQPILANINSLFYPDMLNERASLKCAVVVSDTLKTNASGAALQTLIPVSDLDSFRNQFNNSVNAGSNMVVSQGENIKVALSVVSESSNYIVTRIVSEPGSGAFVAVSYINYNGNYSTFAFSGSSTGEVNGRTFTGQQTNVTYETSSGYTGYVSGNSQNISYYSNATGNQVTVDVSTGAVSTGGTNTGTGTETGYGTSSPVNLNWSAVTGGTWSLATSTPCDIPSNSETYTANVTLSFNGTSVNSAEPGDYSSYASFDNGVLNINAAGTFVLSGNLNGHIYIPNKLSDGVTLVLNGLTVNGQSNGAVYSPKKTPLTIILPNGKSNTLSDFDGQYIPIDEDQGAVVQSKEAIRIMGSGSLTVNANGYIGSTDDYVNGIQAKGSEGIVYIAGGNVSVSSKGGNAIKGKVGVVFSGGTLTADAGNGGTGECLKSEDFIYITGGNLTLTTAGGDAIKAENDWEEDWTGEDGSTAYSFENVATPTGRVFITGGTINATAYGDGIQATSYLEICGGNINITTTNSTYENSNLTLEKSSKGIKCGYSLEKPDNATTIVYGGKMLLTGGTMTINSYDHGISSKGTLDIDYNAGINITVRNPYKQGHDNVYGGKGIKSVKAMNIGRSGNPKIRIFNATEGIECKDILTIAGGENYINCIDDGLNAGNAKVLYNGGTNEDTAYTKDQGNSKYGYTHNIVLAGGTNYIRAGGDGIDANGNITVSGGLTLVSSSGTGDGCLDADGTITYSGGTLVGSGAGNMGTSYPGTNAIVIGTNVNAGTYVNLSSSSGKIMTYAPLTTATHIVYVGSLNSGTTYTAYTGGTDTGSFAEGYSTSGAYIAGTTLGSITYNGSSQNIGNAQGGMGGQPGGQPGQGGQPGGQPGQPPSM